MKIKFCKECLNSRFLVHTEARLENLDLTLLSQRLGLGFLKTGSQSLEIVLPSYLKSAEWRFCKCGNSIHIVGKEPLSPLKPSRKNGRRVSFDSHRRTCKQKQSKDLVFSHE